MIGQYDYFSGKLCDGLDMCYRLWNENFGEGGRGEEGGGGGKEWRWRDNASEEGIRRRDQVDPVGYFQEQQKILRNNKFYKE